MFGGENFGPQGGTVPGGLKQGTSKSILSSGVKTAASSVKDHSTALVNLVVVMFTFGAQSFVSDYLFN